MAWQTSGLVPDHFIAVVPPQMRIGEMWYRGSADAVLQNLNLVDDFEPDLVAVFGADHIYRMDVNQMVAFHREHDADVTVAARPVPVSEASRLRESDRRRDRPGRRLRREAGGPAGHAGRPHARRSCRWGTTCSRARALVERSGRPTPASSTDHDFGKSIIPALVPTARVFAYDFQGNAVPGIKPYEEPGYWRDVGTLEAYWRAHMDLLGETPAVRPRQPALADPRGAATTGRRPGSSAASSRTPRSARGPSCCGPRSGTRSSGAASG